MDSEYPDQISQAARWHGLVRVCLIVVTLLALASCSHPSPGTGVGATPIQSVSAPSSGADRGVVTPSAGATPSTGATPILSPSASTSVNPFRQVDQQVAGLVKRQAIWRVPKRLEVGSTTQLGLVIGDASALQTQIAELVPGTRPQPAGQVQVGATIGVQLEVDPSDADVTPKDVIDQSTGEHTALLWTWFIRATHPNPELFLIAHIVVNMSGGDVRTTDLPLSIPVGRTWQYTLGQIFTNWATWFSIVTVLSGTVAWIWRRRTRQSHASSKQRQPPPRSKTHAGKSPRRR
jgi:hypothetical protein